MANPNHEAAIYLALDALQFADRINPEWDTERQLQHLREQIGMARKHLEDSVTGEPKDGLYVVVCERDTRIPDDDSRPIVFEQFIDQDSATLEATKVQQVRLGKRYGKTQIARLIFLKDAALSQEGGQ